MRRSTREQRSYAYNMAFWCALLIGVMYLWAGMVGNDDKAAGPHPSAEVGR